MELPKIPMIYLAGPITKPEPMENVHDAVVIATQLLDSGLVVPFVPHTTALWHMITPRPYEVWMAYDFAVIEHCAAVLRIDGESMGADREVAHADNLGIPVFYSVDELLRWASA